MIRRSVVLLLLAAVPLPAQQRQDWPVTGGDPGGQRYSPLADIDRSNVGALRPAWSWRPEEAPVPGPRQPIPGGGVRPGSFETTPVVINDTMYLSTPYNRAVALNAETGTELWSYDSRAWEWGQPPNGTGLVHRGIAEGFGGGLDPHLEPVFLQHAAYDCRALVGLVSRPAAPHDQRLAHGMPSDAPEVSWRGAG